MTRFGFFADPSLEVYVRRRQLIDAFADMIKMMDRGCCVGPLPCFRFPPPPNCPPCRPSAVLTCKPRCCPPAPCPPYPCPPLLCPPCRPKPRCCPPKGCLPCTAPTCPSNQVCVRPPPCPRPPCTPLCLPVYAPRAPRVPCVDQRPRIVNVAVHEVRPSAALKFVYYNSGPGLSFCQQPLKLSYCCCRPTRIHDWVQ